ncbi:NAD(P)H-binding protein [Nocardia sp. NPDC006630]|uniref:NAD(P)H-binding protein n=1 Tax=Nocardia sp. NPDC006630 TaxID=3157181 RepID=UPI0033B451BE
MTTVVFGASGNVGKYVAAGLDSLGVPVRLTSRDLSTAGFPPSADAVAADIERPETLSAALEGAQRVFLYAKPDGIDGFVAAAESAGVRHVVLLSSAAVVTSDPTLDPIAQVHAIVEAAIEKSGLDWTFIRPGMFATNSLWLWQRTIRENGIVRLPYPDARTTPVHEKDLAALAVTALTDPGHEGRSYLVSGPEALPLRQQVRHIGEAIGRDIVIEEVGANQARTELLKILPPIAADGILAAWKAGAGTSPVPTSVEAITRRPAHTFAQWAHDHAADFR